MKLILHIGMPKAGSSALQNSLQAAEVDLRRHGILYPAGGHLPKNHNMLVCAIYKVPKLPRLFRQVYAGDGHRMKRDFAAFIQSLEDTVQRNRPETVVLSGEMLFARLPPKKAAALKAVLARLSDDIIVLAYVRSPAQYYLSLAQQVLKASSRIALPRPVPYRQVLESYAQVAGDVRVAAYERAQLYGADITRDFLHRFAPDLADRLHTDATKQANQTISAEGMDILHRYRGRCHADADGVFTRDTGALIRAVNAVELELGGFEKPTIRAAVGDYLNRASVDLLWLRARFGITFSDVDYDRISEDLTPPPPPQAVPEICRVDPVRRDRMLAAIRGRLAGRPAEGVEANVDDGWRDEMLATIAQHLADRPETSTAVRFRTAVSRRKRRAAAGA